MASPERMRAVVLTARQAPPAAEPAPAPGLRAGNSNALFTKQRGLGTISNDD